jgi:hypothetical protein
MGKIHDRIKNETEQALVREWAASTDTLKGCTVRLAPEYIQLIDKLSEYLGETRQTFLSALIYDAADEALTAYASVFKDPSNVVRDTRKACGFPYGFFEFCIDGGLDPSDPDSRREYDFSQLAEHESRVEEIEWAAVQAQAEAQAKEGDQ